MKRTPKPPTTVSVVIPTIPGRERFLARAIRSVQQQDWPPVEWIVEPDPDRTGAAATRNRALERVNGEVVAWLDDDDYLLPWHLKVCTRVLRADPSVGLVYPRPVIDPALDPTATTYRGEIRSPWGIRWCPELAAHIRNHGSFIPMTHLVRTDLVRGIGGFPDGRTLPDGRYQGEDERYLIALMDAGVRFEHVDRKTWVWTVNPQSTAGKPLEMEAAP